MIDLILLPLKILLIAIDLTITLLTFGWIGALKKAVKGESLRSVPVKDDPSHRCHPDFRGKVATIPRIGMNTLYDLAKDACQKYGGCNGMASRQFLGWKVPGKVKEFSEEIVWRSFAQVGKDAHKFGAALRKEGLVPAASTTSIDKITTSCRIAIFENTCAEWMIGCMGAFTQSVSVATVYATLGMDLVVEAVVDNIIRLILCNRKDVAKLVAMLGKMPTLKVIVYTNDLCDPSELAAPLPTPPAGVKIVSFGDFVDSGDVKAFPPTPPAPDTIAVVMYTSGSTGKPKGVIINHRHIVGACASAEVMFDFRKGDVYLAYLPCAHIMELMCEFTLFSLGCTLCYADPKSLTATGSYPVGALEAYQPTHMVAVPKIWDAIKKGVSAKVALGSPIAQFLVKTAFEWRNFCLHHGFDTPLFKALVFKKIKKAVGGKLRFGLSGGGPLNGEVQDFVRTAFGIDFVQGYGLTETCAGLSIQMPDDLRGGIQGAVIPSVEVKMISTPDFVDKGGQPYLSTDRRDVEGNHVFGRGEIALRGTNVTAGYYMMPKETAEAFKEDGWFLTGDIGQFTSDGCVRIVDRKKNLVKLLGGEYIALEQMEMTYGNCVFVDGITGGICCYGDGEMDRPVALMQLNEVVTMNWAKTKGMADKSFAQVKESPELYQAVMDSLIAEFDKSDLCHLEKLVGVTFLTDPWTPENGCLTAANKLQRRAVIQKFEKEFLAVKKKGIFK